MVDLDGQKVIEYFHRCFKAVDGLWFMKVEEKYGFDIALDVDNNVWEVMPKIQARMLTSMLNLKQGPDALLKGLETKLELDGFKFKTEKTKNGFKITITECPWHNLMIKSEREKLSAAVGTTICNTEYQVWVSELAETMKFKLQSQLCKGKECCVLEFQEK